MHFFRRLALTLLFCGLFAGGTGCDSATTPPETKDAGPQPADTNGGTDAEIASDTTGTTDTETPADTPTTTDTSATTDATTTDTAVTIDAATTDMAVATDALPGDACDPNPCENGGVCAPDGDGYSCACDAGYSGVHCETNTDDCAVDPCENGGTCQDGVDSYTCTCVEGYTGTKCETPPLASVILQQDFESTEEDAIPADWHSFVGWMTDQNNTKDGQAYALVDSTKPHGGSRSLHVVGGSLPAMLTVALPPGTKTIYVRTYVWLTQKMGQNPGNNHETLLGIRKSVGGAYDEVRFGEIKGVIGTNEVPSDDISPKMEQWGKGPLISAGAWHCVEVAFLGEGPNHQIIAWNDGEEVHRVDDPSQWNNKALGPTFLEGKFVEFMIGWHSFSNYDNEVWFDDLVIAKEKIGCN